MAGTVKKLRFSEGTDVGAPTDLSLATSTTTIEAYATEVDYAVANGAPGNGSVFVDTTERTFKSYSGGAWRTCWVEEDPTDATKLIVKDLSGQATGVVLTLASLASVNRTFSFPDKTGQGAVWEAGQALNAPAAGNASIGANVGANNLTIGGASTTTVIPGNLQVQGTTTQVDTTNMNVKDQNILINDGGNDASAEGAGLTVERTGTDGSLAYEDALASKFKIGALGSESEVVTVDDVQTIENKRIRLDTTAAANDATSPRLVVPGAPLATLQGISAGNHDNKWPLYYATDVKKFYWWEDSSSTLRPLGTGSGSGGTVNFIALTDSAFDFEADIAGWNTYDDGATATPVDGTGGSPSVITISRNTTTPLNGTADLKISKSAADGQGEGASLDIPVPRGYQYGQTIGISLLLDTISSAAYASGDLGIYVYDVDNSALRPVTIVNVPGGSLMKHNVYFSGTDSANYRLIFHCQTTNASAWVVEIDDVSFGPVEEQVASSKITRWRERDDILFSSGTVIQTYFFKERQVGEDIEAEFEVKIGSGSSGGGSFYVEIPGYDVDGAVEFALGGTLRAVGHSTYYQSPSVYFGQVNWAGTAGAQFVILSSYNIADSVGSRLRTMGEADMNNNDLMVGTIKFKPTQLVGMGTLYEATNDVEWVWNGDLADADASTTFRKGFPGAQFANFSTSHFKRVELSSPWTPEDHGEILISQDGGFTWQDLSSNGVVFQWEVQNTITYGMSWNPVTGDPTKIDIIFGVYRAASAATYGGAGASWSNIDNDPQYRWIFRRTKKGLALGFKDVSDTNFGVVPALSGLARVQLSGSNGSGSVDTSIRAFLNIDLDQGGTDIVYNQTANNGATFTIGRNGFYAITYVDLFFNGAAMGISKNSTQLGSNIGAINDANMLAMATTTAGSVSCCVSGVFYLEAGDVIRPHHDGSADASSGDGHRTRWYIHRLV